MEFGIDLFSICLPVCKEVLGSDYPGDEITKKIITTSFQRFAIFFHEKAIENSIKQGEAFVEKMDRQFNPHREKEKVELWKL